MASETSWKGTEDENDTGEHPPVEALIRKLMERVEDSERRYSEALEDLHMRLDQLSNATVEAKTASAAEDSATLDRLHAQVSDLAKRLSDEPVAETSESASDVFSKLAEGSKPFGEPGFETAPEEPAASPSAFGDSSFGAPMPGDFGSSDAGTAPETPIEAPADDGFSMTDAPSFGEEAAPKAETPLLLPEKEEKLLAPPHEDTGFQPSGSGFGDATFGDSSFEGGFGQPKPSHSEPAPGMSDEAAPGFGKSEAQDDAFGHTFASEFGNQLSSLDSGDEAGEDAEPSSIGAFSGGAAHDSDYARRLITAAQRLEDSLGGIVPSHQITLLNTRMDEIAASLDEALQRSESAGPNVDALQKIDDQIAELAQQLGRAEEEIAKIGNVDDQLKSLAARIDAQPSQLEDVAHKAAHEAARLVGDEIQAQAAGRFDAIHDDLSAMKTQTTATGDRLSESLKAVQESLQKFAAQVERGPMPAQRRAPFQTPPTGGAMEMESGAGLPPMPGRPMAPKQPGLSEPAASAHEEAHEPSAPPPLTSRSMPMPEPKSAPDNSLRSQLASILPDDKDEPVLDLGHHEAMPEEPKSGNQRKSLLKRNRADEEASDSFVAAARRAAKAAAEQAQQDAARSWAGRAKAAKDRLISSEASSSDAAPRTKKRSYLLFVAFILLVVSASLLYSRLRHRSEPAKPAATEQTTPAPKASGVTGVPGSSSSSGPQAPAPKPEKSGGLPEPTTPQFGGSARASIDVPKSTASTGLPTLPPQPVSLRSDDNQGLPPGVSVSITPPPGPLPSQADAAPAKPKTASLPLAPADAGPYALRAAAAAGDPKAQYLLGLNFTNKTSPAYNMKEALRWLRLAGMAGLAPAEYRLGVLYERGEGVAFDLGMAQHWYRRAAQQGNIKAMHNLAVLLGGENGNGDYTTAAKWYQRAASRGLADSQFNLGVLKEHGLGVAKNLPEAYEWYALAAEQNDPDAAKRRDQVKAELTPSELQTANAAIKAWKSAPVDAAANGVTANPAWVASAPRPSAALIKHAQQLLNQLGYNAGPTDGQFGDQTEAAIIAFEHKNGITASGVVDQTLISRLEKLAS